MGWLTPSDDDKQEDKKPRFLQDMIAFIIMAVVGVLVILYLMIWG